MSRHRETALRPGQDPLEAIGRTVWTQRRPNGDELVVRAYLAPRPHVGLECWRGGERHEVRLLVPELAEVTTALLQAARAIVRERSEAPDA